MPRVAYSLIYVLLVIDLHTAMDVCSGPNTYTCKYSNEPSSCNGSLLVKTNKTSQEYQLSLCHDNQCYIGELTFNFRCCQICEACISLDPEGKNKNTPLYNSHSQMDKDADIIL